MLTLDLALATWKPDGILRVAAMDLPVVAGVRYVVSWQASENAPIPDELQRRDDVVVYRTDVVGVSANRNNALDHCDADIVLNSDDDLAYTAKELRAVQRVFENDPDVELATFKYNNAGLKRYPSVVTDLRKMPKNYWVGTIEIAVRRNSPAGQLRFNTLFGPGAPYIASGEDEIFLLTARRRGMVCRFYPIQIATHYGLSTGTRRITNINVLHGMGAVLRLSYGLSSLPRVVLKAYRLARRGQVSLLRALKGLLQGWHYARKITL